MKKCLFVIGMHRSGTSAFAGCMKILGYELGNNLLPPSQFNEKGYFENREILNINDTIFSRFNIRWHDVDELPVGWQDDAIISDIYGAASKVIESQFGDSENICIKGPRLPRLFPFWERVLDGYEIRCLIPVRHPMETARSLKLRDGREIDESLKLWYLHILSMLANTDSTARYFRKYTDLINDPVGTLQDIPAPIKPIDAENKLREFVSADLRHNIEHEPTGIVYIDILYNKLKAFCEKV